MKRRTLLQASGAAAAATAFGAIAPVTATARASTPNTEPPVGYRPLKTESNDLAPYTGAWTDDTLRHLLRRSLFGVPQSQFETAKALGGMSQVIDKLLEASDVTKVPLPKPPDSWMLGAPAFNVRTGTELERINYNRYDNARLVQLANWWLDMTLKQGISLRERMTLLWTNHFVTGSQTVQTGTLTAAPYMYTYLQTCREYAMGNLKSFTRAIAIDPAMLVYLNGNQNYVLPRQRNINENFARELLELFTLGLLDPKTLQPNYTEVDIQQAARALAGWQPTQSAPYKGVLIDGTLDIDGKGTKPDYRDNAPKTFLGKTGNWYLDDILNIIFDVNGGYNAAYFFCQKIYQALVYYVPNAGVVDAMANLLVQSKFEIAPVLQALLSSAHFYDANVIGSQLKSPMDFIGTLVRELGLIYPPFSNAEPVQTGTTADKQAIFNDPNPNLTLFYYLMSLQGQTLLDPPNVKGWPGGHNWITTGTFQNREIYTYLLLYGYFDNTTVNRQLYNIKFDPAIYSSQIQNDTSIIGDELAKALENVSSAFTFGPFEGGDLATLMQMTYPKPNYKYNSADVKNFAQYLAMLPEFQLY